MRTCPNSSLATLIFVAIGFFRLSSMESRFRSLPLDRSGNTQEPFDDADARGADRENSSIDSYGRIRFLAHPTPVENLGCVEMNNIRANGRSWTDRSSVFVGFTARRSLFFPEANPYKVGVARFSSMQSNDIEVLINRVGMGDRAAFVALYQATSPKLMGVCLRILKNRSDAEEALQEIYIKIWQRAKTFATGHSGPFAWLATIARNHAIDTIRARKPVSDDLDAAYDLADDTTPNPEQRMGIVDEGRRIDRCMAELDPAHASAVRRAYVEGLSYIELADDLRVPLNTVRTWLRRSLLKLKECIQR